MYVCMNVYTVHTVCCNGHGYKLNFTCSSAKETTDTSASKKQKIYKTNRIHGRKVPDHQRGTDDQRLRSRDGISRSKEENQGEEIEKSEDGRNRTTKTWWNKSH